MAAGDATYATQADVEGYIEGFQVDDPAALKRLIERAERDIDSVVGGGHYQANGLKFGHPLAANELSLRKEQVAALTRATCAQVEYRLTMGEQFFIEPEYDSVSGPDFSVQGTRPRIAPKAWREIRGSGLILHPMLVV
jgi:hypothetical protein